MLAIRHVTAVVRSLDQARAENTADRAIICTALGNVTRDIAATIADLQEHLYPARRFGSRNSRLAAVEAAMYHAADMIEVAADNLTDCAGLIARAMVSGDLVDYQGSLTAHRGLYRLTGPCICDDCDDAELSTLQLRALTGNRVLVCVSPAHITAMPTGVSPALTGHATNAGNDMRAAVRSLATPLPPVDAVPLVNALAALTRRLPAIVETLADADATREGWMVDTAYTGHLFGYTPGYRHPRQRIREILSTAPVALTEGRVRLRRAVALLADLAEDSNRPGAAA